MRRNRGTVYLFPELNVTEGSDALTGYNYKWLLSRNIRLNHTCSIMSFTPALYSDPTRLLCYHESKMSLYTKFNLQVILLPLLLALCMIVAACSSITLPADGHGTATITPSDRLIAGSRETIIITFTVGAGGIPVGGGVMLGLHHMSKFQDLQIDHADKTGYMTVEGEKTNNFALEWHPGTGTEGGYTSP